MVVIALLVVTGFSGMDPWILLPATVIMALPPAAIVASVRPWNARRSASLPRDARVALNHFALSE